MLSMQDIFRLQMSFKDSDANITDTLVTWIGDESRVTRNKIILGVIDQKTKTTIKSLDDIKKELNVTLGQAFKQTSCIVTNDDGLQWLDTLKMIGESIYCSIHQQIL